MTICPIVQQRFRYFYPISTKTSEIIKDILKKSAKKSGTERFFFLFLSLSLGLFALLTVKGCPSYSAHPLSW